ncbi:helix-turn-helix transcriptional regulator [Bifidobacterium gallicum]|nr:LuxR C-terminal-related transcriptional regulator [Bifidobacterium gallicum]
MADTMAMRIALIEHDAFAAHMLLHLLNKTFPHAQVDSYTGRESNLIRRIAQDSYDVVVACMELDLFTGPGLCAAFRKLNDHTPLLGITSYPAHRYEHVLRQCGAQGLVSKNEPKKLLAAVASTAQHRVMHGFTQPYQAHHDLLQRRTLHRNLSAREATVLHLFMQYGNNSKAIGRDLHIHPETARKHLQNIRRKLGVADLTELRTVASNYDLELA